MWKWSQFKYSEKDFPSSPNRSLTHDLPEYRLERSRGLMVSEVIYWVLICDTCPANCKAQIFPNVNNDKWNYDLDKVEMSVEVVSSQVYDSSI